MRHPGPVGPVEASGNSADPATAKIGLNTTSSPSWTPGGSPVASSSGESPIRSAVTITTRAGPTRSTSLPPSGPANEPSTAPPVNAAAIAAVDVPPLPSPSGTSRSIEPNAIGSISATASAARNAGWRNTLRLAPRRSRSATTVRPAGASRVQTTPAALTAATSRKAGAEPTQAASAPMAGPAIDPADSIPITIPDSRPRRPPGALSVTQAMDAVQIEPLAVPCTNRAATSTGALGANAKMTVEAVMRSADTSVIRRAPKRGTSRMHATETNGTAAG